jgi:hypothetical protein
MQRGDIYTYREREKKRDASDGVKMGPEDASKKKEHLKRGAG